MHHPANQDEANMAGRQSYRRVTVLGMPHWILLSLLGLLTAAGCYEPTPVTRTPTHSPANSTATSRDDPRTASSQDQATDNPATHAAEAPAASPPAENRLAESAPGDGAPNLDLDQLKLGMVSIATPTDGPLGYGVVYHKSSTGFDVITADHVLDGRKQISVQAWQVDDKQARLQSYLATTVMHRDPEKDLAWLRVRASDTSVQPLQLAKSTDRSNGVRREDRTGQLAWTYQVRDNQASFESCEIEQRTSARRTAGATPVSYWRLNRSIEPGLSGGGLVDKHGAWIGIASGNSRAQAHYVDETEIDHFLKQAGLK